MSTILRLVALISLCALVLGAFAIDAEEIEVAVAADGSVVAEKRPNEAVAIDFDGGSRETRVQSSAATAEGDANDAERMGVEDSQHESDVVAAMTTLQQELTAVEQMVTLQEKKLQVLKKMRRVWLQEQQDGEKVKQRTGRVDVADVIARRVDAAVADTVAETMARDFDTYFVERASIMLEGGVVDMKMVKMRATSAQELIAVAYKNGLVVFYTTAINKELLRIDTKRVGIKSIALELQDDQPCLVVIHDAATIAVYELNVVEKSNGGAVDASGGREVKQEKPYTVAISVEPEYLLRVNRHREIALSAKVSALALARSSRQLVVAVAKSDGIIEFLALNGTSLRQMQTNASIAVMETRRSLLAFSYGADVIVSSMTRAQGFTFHQCLGSSAQVSSIAFDMMHPEIMYAGTQRGEILVYAVYAGASAEAQPCQLLSRSVVTNNPRDVAPVVLASTKMYVIAVGLHDITVFNVSKAHRRGVSLARMCSNKLKEPMRGERDDGITNLPVMEYSEGVTMGSHLAILSTNINGQRSLHVYYSLLPDEKETSEFQWPMLVYGVVVVVAIVGSQLFIRWQRRTSVNPWDSTGKPRDTPYGKFEGFKGREHTASDFDDEDFGRDNSLSDDLRRKIAQAKKGSAYRSMDDEADY